MAKSIRKEIREILGEACTDDIENRLVALHLSVVDPMKDEIAKCKADNDKLEAVTKERNELKAQVDANKDLQAKYEKAVKDLEKANGDFTAYKNEQTAKETKAAKMKAAKAYVEGKGITGANTDIAMMALQGDIDGLELDGETIKDTATLDAKINGALKGLIVTQQVKGAKVEHPPKNTGGAMTKEQIMAIKDDGERQREIAKNHELFGF